MMSLGFYLHRPAVIRNMTAQYSYDSGLQTLLSSFGSKELKLLQKSPDLIDKLHEISQMDENTAYIMLEEDFSLNMDEYGTACWVGTQNISDNEPSWVKTTHVGWAVSGMEEFMELARDLLAQQVRVNLWMRWVERKKKSKSHIIYDEDFGMYL